MSSQLDGGVELLERALGYTRTALARVDRTDLTRPTPCSRWDLAALLAHMDDALDAFLEAAGGLLVLTAALEITVHGWDVARALRLDHPLPPALAADLLPVARGLVGHGRFAPALTVASDPAAPSGVRLLGWVGREAG